MCWVVAFLIQHLRSKLAFAVGPLYQLGTPAILRRWVRTPCGPAARMPLRNCAMACEYVYWFTFHQLSGTFFKMYDLWWICLRCGHAQGESRLGQNSLGAMGLGKLLRQQCWRHGLAAGWKRLAALMQSMCPRTHVFTCIYIYMYTYSYMYIYISLTLYVCLYVYITIHIYIYICIYVYTQ